MSKITAVIPNVAQKQKHKKEKYLYLNQENQIYQNQNTRLMTHVRFVFRIMYRGSKLYGHQIKNVCMYFIMVVLCNGLRSGPRLTVYAVGVPLSINRFMQILK